MEEERKPQRNWIRAVGLIIQFASVIGVLALAVYCNKNGNKDYLTYDRVRGILLPPEGFESICLLIFWAGFAGSMLVIGYEILRAGETISKILGTAVAVIAFLLTIYANAFIASAMFVNEGLGFQPRYEAEINGDEGLLTVHCNHWQTVQVYYLYLNEDAEDEAVWVDGYDVKEPARIYEVHEGPNGFMREKQIHIYNADHEEHHSKLVYPKNFPY